MILAQTINQLLDDPVFIICAPVGVIVVVLLIAVFGGGDIDL